jgi:hypothetical protein
MTQEDVVVLWKDANGWDVRGYKNTLEDLEAFAKLVAAKATAKEREACAKVCEEFHFGQAPMMIQRAIRARGEA